MPTVGFGESIRYGLRLYAYVLAVFIVGAVGVGLGAALLWPEIRAWRGPAEAAVAPGVAGGILLVLGLSVLTVGWLGTAYKLIADGVAAGSGPGPASGADDSRPADDPVPTIDDGTDGTARTAATRDEQPPEPSPSEIAFGAEDEGAGETGSLPGGDGGSDPLGNRTE